jgi:hypothetical protein
MKIVIKIILICLFVGCLERMSYSYYQITKFLSFAGFIVIAYLDYKDRIFILIPLSIAGIILFNPLFKVHFKRPVWQLLDRYLIFILAAWIIIDISIVFYNRRFQKK